eukprot:2833593-Pyramimonas_sp.AAC.1
MAGRVNWLTPQLTTANHCHESTGLRGYNPNDNNSSSHHRQETATIAGPGLLIMRVDFTV